MKSRSREINVFSMSALDLFASALGAFILISIVLMPYFLHVDPEEVAKLRQELQQERSTLAETRRRLQEAQSELQQCRQQEAACREDLAALEQEVTRLQDMLDRAQADLAEAREDLQQAQSELQQCRQQEAACREELDALRQEASALQQCQAELNACEEKLSRTFLAIVIQWSTKIHDVDLHVIDPAGERFYYEAKTISGRPGELSADTTIGPGVEIWEVPEALVGKYQVLYSFFSNEDDDDKNEGPAIVKGGVYHRDGHDRLDKRTLTKVIGNEHAKAVLVATVTVKDDGSVEISQR